MDIYECSYRTAQREIDGIRMIFPLQEKNDGEGKKRFYLSLNYIRQDNRVKVPYLDLDAGEATALMFLWSRSEIFKNTQFSEYINRAFNKIFTIDRNHLQQFRTLSEIMLMGDTQNKDYSDKEEILEDLISAMLSHKVCRVIYHSFWDDKIKTYNIHPLHLFQRDGGFYFFTQINEHTDIRTLALERIKTLEIMDETFIRPNGFDPQELLDTAFNLTFEEPREYKILFSRNQARYIRERKWASDQKIKTQNDGRLLLTMTTSGWYDVKKWIMSYGSEAQVIEPVELKEEILKEWQLCLENYN